MNTISREMKGLSLPSELQVRRKHDAAATVSHFDAGADQELLHLCAVCDARAALTHRTDYHDRFQGGVQSSTLMSKLPTYLQGEVGRYMK